jgi:hypothetical protein
MRFTPTIRKPKLIKHDVSECLCLSVFVLCRNRCFINGNNGDISWGYDKPSSIKFQVSIGARNFIELEYIVFGENKRYQVLLSTTKCNFGGRRYWFLCPASTNGQYCGKRVAVLYLAPNSIYFACRHCCKLTYPSRKLSGVYKKNGRTLSLPEIDELKMKVKRTTYNGKPTKSYLRYIRELNRFESVHNVWYKDFTMSINKLKIRR